MPDAHEHVVGPRKQRQYLIGKRKRAGVAMDAGPSDVQSPGTESISIAALQKLFSKDPEITLVDVLGSPDQPEVLVALIDTERAEQLKRQHPHLIIEENEPLDQLESC